MRSNLPNGRITRVIFCVSAGHMVLLHGFEKKTQKTPKPDLELARKRQKEIKKMSDKNPHLGSSFEDFLNEEGIAGEVNATAIKHVLAWQIEQAMKEQGISKNQMAKRMRTSRAYLDRFLDPKNDKVQLDTVQRAAAAIGRKLKLELV